MKCFEHPDRDAVAACKHCVKGLCRECSHMAEGGTSCAGSCAEQVAAQHAMFLRSQKFLDRGRRTIDRANASLHLSIYLLVIMGIGMAAWGMLTRKGDFALYAGTLMLVCGLAGRWAIRRKNDGAGGEGT